jgi:uncharacterized protein YpmS
LKKKSVKSSRAVRAARVLPTRSGVRSTAKPKSDETGTTPTNVEDRLNSLLTLVVKSPQRVKCDYIRNNAEIVAMAASMQLITTRTRQGVYNHAWRITIKGLSYIHQQRD